MYHSSHIKWQQVAMPTIIRYMFRYGILGGLFFGLLGQFAFRFFLKEAILAQPHMSIRYTFSALATSVIILSASLGIIIIILASQWRAPSKIARTLMGMAVGFGFALATHTMFVGGVAGLLASRASIIYLYADYTAQPDAGIGIALDSIFRTFFEGYGITFMIVFVLTFFGEIFSSWLIPLAEKETEEDTLKDAFGSLAVVLLPLVFVLLILSNVILHACMSNAMHFIAEDINHPRLDFPITTLVALLPMISIPIVQLFGILWVHRARPENVHRMVLRLAQIIHALTMGVALLPFANYMAPKFAHSPFGFVMITTMMALAWIFALVAQWKLGERRMQNAVRASVPFWSLMQSAWVVVILAWLLLDLFTARVLFNLNAFHGRMSDYAYVGYTPIFEVVPDMLTKGLLSPAISLGIYAVLTCFVVTIIVGPILWFFNLFES